MTVNGASTRTATCSRRGRSPGAKDTRGAFIELTWGGAEPVKVGGEERTFVLDGDEVVITGPVSGRLADRLRECRGRVVPARD